ncbi:MBL fold metallo-hydrolase [Leptolyngbya sp. 7M]|uniref:MBL fold metallo-hydrolase n=1 Tax=Leptolyngbya sp. 7M TaxID=2812896 RepID=UPI001B8AB8C8|nr:MBL fold metallo-hydrolase [Leptolyngbya sp. 7M]QYO65615.1 MBL fold metallo-hydrolase [Leptolyngbya sp. 7M]
MLTITEIAPDIFRINTFISEANLGFSQFLVRDEEPLLFHTGMRALFPMVREAVGSLIDPAKLRWIGFSHFEADECGSLNEWQAVAPHATAVCSMVGKMVSIDDYSQTNPAKGMVDGEEFSTGSHKFRFLATPHVPHNWEAGLLYELTAGVLFSSDILHQNGDVEPLTFNSVTDRTYETLNEMQAGPLAGYLPYSVDTDETLRRIAELKPKTIATMHGSVYSGNGENAILEYAKMLKDVLGRKN